MRNFDLNDLSPQQIVGLVSVLNSDGILHALTGSTLRVSEEDAIAVSNAISTMRNHQQGLGEVHEVKSDRVRYDISEFHAFETAFLRERLSRSSIEFELENGVLSVPRSNEGEVDQAIRDSESALKTLEAEQEMSRAIHSGRLSPSCEICGRFPAAPIDLRRQVGMIVVMTTYRAEMTLCESCASDAYKQFQRSTAIKGWTGVKSALMNPFVLGTNAVNRNRHRKKLKEGN